MIDEIDTIDFGMNDDYTLLQKRVHKLNASINCKGVSVNKLF